MAAPAPLSGPGAGAFMREELTASLVLSHAARWHPRQVVVDGDTLAETTWADLARRAFVFGLALRRRLLPAAAAVGGGEAEGALAGGAAGGNGGAAAGAGAAAAAAPGAAAAPSAAAAPGAAAAPSAAAAEATAKLPPPPPFPPPPPPPPPAVVATLAHNSARHLEAWYAVSAAAAGVVHTLNPRLSPADLRHIVSHAGCTVVCAEPEALPLLAALGPWAVHCPRVAHVVFLCDARGMPGAREVASALGSGVRAHCHETLIEEEVARLAATGDDGKDDGDDDGNGNRPPKEATTPASLLASLQPPYPWPHVSEDAAAGLAYTSGTTGAPKGVLFSHRANFLTALAASLPDALCLGARSTVLMAVPLYHAVGWQLPHAAPMTGARLVMPHPSQLGGDGSRLLKLIERTGCDTIACVPTVYQALVGAARRRAADAAARGDLAAAARPLGPLRSAVVGGAACPRALAEALETEMGVAVKSLWGMTELAPIGTVTGASRGAIDAMRREGGQAGGAAAGGEEAAAAAAAAAAGSGGGGGLAAGKAAERALPVLSLLPPTAVTPTVAEISAAASDRASERAAVAEGLLRLATGQGRPHCLVDMRIVRRRKRAREGAAAAAEGDGASAAAASGRGEQQSDGARDAAAAADNDDDGDDDDDDDLEELPHDGVAFGHLQVRGGTVMRRYHRGAGDEDQGDENQGENKGKKRDTVVETVRASAALRLSRGLPGYPPTISREWFDTGDVGSIDAGAGGCVRLTDRAKDVIKSGGEWISSIALESAASRHGGVASAAAVGVPHAKWGERPLLVVVRRRTAGPLRAAPLLSQSGGETDGGKTEQDEKEEGGQKKEKTQKEQGDGGGDRDLAALKRSILDCVAADPRLARWQVPDDVVFVEALPLSATGKVSKLELRRAWKGHYGG